jgi:hypothetical protein
MIDEELNPQPFAVVDTIAVAANLAAVRVQRDRLRVGRLPEG